MRVSAVGNCSERVYDMAEQDYITMRHISKAFYGVPVLSDVEIHIQKGEVHALIGENGAGKSTLMKILAGLYQADAGEISIDGVPVSIQSPQDGMRYGIRFIHQELSMVPGLSIAQNFFLGQERHSHGFLDKKAMDRRVTEVLESFWLHLQPDMPVDTLSVAQQQMVEIGRAISFDAKIIIMDEPTASLTGHEVEQLFEQVRRLRELGVTMIFISHKLEELLEISDRVTVLRDGRLVATERTEAVTQNQLIELMVGRKLRQMYTVRPRGTDEVVLEARHLQNRNLHDISFSLHRGEVLGISGLVGAGRTELAHAIFGIDKLFGGELYLSGQRIQHRNAYDAIRNGFALVPEDRKENGLVLVQEVGFNITLCVMRQIKAFFRVNWVKEGQIIDTYAKTMNIKMAGRGQICNGLSGGNQQKVVFSKWLATEPKIIILDEPTRGIDVGAKAEIYHIITDLASKGLSVIMISSELPEIMNLSSRVLVMHEGHMMKIIDAESEEFTQERIMYYATGGAG